MKAKKADCRKLTPEGQEKLRQQVTAAIIERKMKQREAVALFQVSRAAIIKWLKEYRQKGLESLKRKSRGRPKASGKLDIKEVRSLLEIMVNSLPDEIGLEHKLWNKGGIKVLISRKFKKELSLLTVTRLLARENILPKKPVRFPEESNAPLIEEWLKSEYLKILRIAKREKAEVQWGIAQPVNLRLESSPVASAKKKSGFLHYIIASIKNNGQFQFRLTTGKPKPQLVTGFLSRLTKGKKKVFFLTSKEKIFETSVVDSWLARNQKKIELYFFP
ncbi:transposase [Candidatus Margulisiibacteriota bacterium]